MVKEFNSNDPSSIEFLICSYDVGSYGLNLHIFSHMLFQVDPPENMAQDD